MDEWVSMCMRHCIRGAQVGERERERERLKKLGKCDGLSIAEDGTRDVKLLGALDRHGVYVHKDATPQQ